MSALKPNLKTWFSVEDWKERIITADPSWFTVPMGTGVCTQLLSHFPYSAQWLTTIAYIFWIADICLFAFFMTLGILRVFLYPHVAKNVLQDFSQTSNLGAIAVAFETIILGIVSCYSHHASAMYVAEAMFWIAAAMSCFVAFGGLFIMYERQPQHSFKDLNGAWFLTFIPLIVDSTVGGAISPYLAYKNSITVLVISFLMWSVGVGMSLVILSLYIWRLMSCSLPPRVAIISTFVPVGPFGMGAYSIQQLAVGLASQVREHKFTLTRPPQPPNDAATMATIAEGIHWTGIIVALFLLGLASFLLVEACFSIYARVPKTFNVGYWSFVFPCGVYANAWNEMSQDIRSSGMKGWGATCSTAVVVLWLFCALMSFYKGVWQGKLFFAPGLQGWLEQQEVEKRMKAESKPEDGRDGLDRGDRELGYSLSRQPQSDGSYRCERRKTTNGDRSV
ncbi:voltage-dependent anion channel-domain-containing protein [Exophiala viscosa]|uniref:Voltage-dependent anion channel-domain-containing protein n=1 Tax=Exophiala viscosa TaxID=2486360 RepID=A0AAN6I9U6_9EURO|nr:voltage-dependent anion channel-domain-containing protein [Exophiala viscosa]